MCSHNCSKHDCNHHTITCMCLTSLSYAKQSIQFSLPLRCGYSQVALVAGVLSQEALVALSVEPMIPLPAYLHAWGRECRSQGCRDQAEHSHVRGRPELI